MRLLLPLVLLCACAEPQPSVDAEEVRAVIPYDFTAPAAAIALPAELREISGLTVLPSGRLGAVEDESGVVYEVDPATGAIVDALRFGGPGDFEGIALVPGDALWALRSDGDLFLVARDSAGEPTSRKVETALRSRNDTEGLAYDPASGALLIACKEWPGEDPETGDNYRGLRTIWAFDLATETLSERPVATLDRSVLDRPASEGGGSFKPSALAVHPTTGELYVLSSVRRSIAVLRGGALVAAVDLPGGILPQPEGLAFTADGTLYIASEGPTGPGTLLRFPPVVAE